MIVAVLFNSDHPKFNGVYGDTIKKLIFDTGVIQESNRHMKVSVGDVLIFSHSETKDQYFDLCEKTYFAHSWHRLQIDKLIDTFGTATVYSIVFENMTEQIADRLNQSLMSEESYLGLHAVELAYGPHLVFYRNCMIEMFRVHGQSCRIFYSMSEDDEKDEYQEDFMKECGFSDVDWEDSGGRKTIFDDFDTPDHFASVLGFRSVVGPHLENGEDDAYELSMVLSDLNPKLFQALGAAVGALAEAKNAEQVAQVAVSGRRYLKQLSDVVFPATNETRNGRSLKDNAYKNRLWAFVEDETNDKKMLAEIGGEIDRLDSVFNKGVHAELDVKDVEAGFVDIAKLTTVLLSLNPEEVRKPYYAYSANILGFLRETISSHQPNSD